MPKNALKRRIFLVEDHPVTREGFAQLINYQGDLQVCGQAGTVAEALVEIPMARADLAIVDISLPDGDGIELVKELHAMLPDLPILVLSMHDETRCAGRALQAGALGYVMKQEATGVVMGAIRKVLQGERYLNPENQMSAPSSHHDAPITPRPGSGHI
jgi:DNA-binding NarL/FixJ family response regulator